ncbi:MAG: glycosyltransferase family 1 protein [Bacteroidaceae bacterium]
MTVPLKIAFDAKRAAQNRTGLGNYSRFVIEGLSTYYPENEYQLYAPNPNKSKLCKELAERSNCDLLFPDSTCWQKLPSLWRIGGIKSQLEREKPTLFHGLSNELPLTIKKIKGLRKVVTIHDLIFLRYPQFYKTIDRAIYTYKFRKACENADAIVAVSECTKRDIIHFFNIPAEKITVIYQGCDSSFYTKATEEQKKEAQKKYQLPEKYLLYVGSIETRKNLKLIVEALKKTRSDLPLIAIGKHTPYADEVQEYANKNGISERLKMLHGVEFRYFPSIYQEASLFIYPSLFEGFGIPLLEALCSKTPVIGATGSCLEEAGGPDSIYVSPNNATELAEGIDKVLENPMLANKMIEKGSIYATRFNPEQLAKEMNQLYQSIR